MTTVLVSVGVTAFALLVAARVWTGSWVFTHALLTRPRKAGTTVLVPAVTAFEDRFEGAYGSAGNEALTSRLSHQEVGVAEAAGRAVAAPDSAFSRPAVGLDVVGARMAPMATQRVQRALQRRDDGRTRPFGAPRGTTDLEVPTNPDAPSNAPEMGAVLWVSSLDARFDPEPVDLPARRTRITVGRPGTDVPLPGVSAELALSRTGSRWAVSADIADAAYLGGIPLRGVQVPVPSGIPITVGDTQLMITYQRPDPRWDPVGTRLGGAGFAVVRDQLRPGLRTLVASVLGMCFDPWEPRCGLASVTRGEAALQALGIPLPDEVAVVGLRDDGQVEVVASGRVRVWTWDPEGARLLRDENFTQPTRVLVSPRGESVLALALGGDASDDDNAEMQIGPLAASVGSLGPVRVVRDELAWLILDQRQG
jgi:hypothetical protein